MTAYIDPNDLGKALRMYAELTGRSPWPRCRTPLGEFDAWSGGRLTRWRVLKPVPKLDSGISYHRDGNFSAGEVKEQLEALFHSAGLRVEPYGARYFRVAPVNSAMVKKT